MNDGALAEMLAELDAELADYDVGTAIPKQMVAGVETAPPREHQSAGPV